MELQFTAHFCGSYGQDTFPSSFQILINENPKIIMENGSLSLETKINPNDDELFFFTSVNSQIYRIRIYLGCKNLTGDIKIRLNDHGYYLLTLFTQTVPQ